MSNYDTDPEIHLLLTKVGFKAWSTVGNMYRKTNHTNQDFYLEGFKRDKWQLTVYTGSYPFTRREHYNSSLNNLLNKHVLKKRKLV